MNGWRRVCQRSLTVTNNRELSAPLFSVDLR
jgi:hypothetical protein